MHYSNDIHTIIVNDTGYIKTSHSLNSATENKGITYNINDETTSKGMEPEYLAREIINALNCEEEELIVCDLKTRIGLFLRYFFPSILFDKLKNA